MNRNRRRDLWWPGVTLAAAGLALLALVIVLLPAVLAPRSAFATAAEAVAAQNDVRATLLQALGGAIVVIGALSGWRQVQLGREGLVTERFSRAIDQLGHDKREVRVGGIHALARIARTSPQDRSAIVEVLAAYLRGANLRGAKLDGARLDRVRTDAATIWPDQADTLPAELKA